MKRRFLLLGLVLLVAVGAGGAWYARHHRAQPAATKQSTSRPPAIQQSQDRLAIAAIRSRSYPGSAITSEQQLNSHESIVSYRSDGLKVYALMSTPSAAKPDAGWPVIILLHGYENPANYQTAGAGYRQFINAFTNAGYMVVKPDFRGHGKSEGEPEGGHFSPVYAYDTLNLIASLKQDNQVDAKRIGLAGHSMGGHVALRTAVVSKDVKATAFIAGVVGSMDDFFYNWPHSPAPSDQPIPLTRSFRQALVNKYGDPRANPQFWHDASAINYVDAIAGPVQINHDAADSVVPKLFSDHLDAALQAAHKPVEYHVYPGDDHQFTQNRAALLQNLLAFYGANL